MRYLKLTSPYAHGADVVQLQKALGDVKVDGQYGPQTAAAVSRRAYAIGLLNRDGSPAVQRLIEHPRLRTPGDYRRAKQRREAAAKQGQGLSGVISHALSHVGVHENPLGSNRGQPFPSGWERNFGIDGQPWCGCFAGSMVLAAGGHVTSRVAYVPYIISDARSGANGFARFVPYNGDRSQVKPGWLVTYDWSGGHANGAHVGVVKEITSGGVIACEGNTSGTDPSDGGMVAVMTRSSADIVGYAEPKFS